MSIEPEPGDLCRLLAGIQTYTLSHLSDDGYTTAKSEDVFLYLYHVKTGTNMWGQDVVLFRGKRMRVISGVLVKVQNDSQERET